MTDKKNINPNRPWIIAIGSSAGGLEALKEVFTFMPKQLDVVFIVMQHLQPDKPSHLADILSTTTAYQFIEAVDGEMLKKNTVYCIPAGFLAEIENKQINLISNRSEQNKRTYHSIDHLFKSLSNNYARQTIAVVLSGSSDDGADGMLAIRNAGGLGIAQNQQTAKFADMPKAAAEFGKADVILSPQQIGNTIGEYLKNQQQFNDVNNKSTNATQHKKIMPIVEIIKQLCGEDFSGYKPSTLTRRIERRMLLTGHANFKDYEDTLINDAVECKELAKDMLISVTSFFRDKPAFDLLIQQVIPSLFENNGTEKTIRVWIAGCATGEEAYSIAMLLSAYREAHQLPHQIQVFASDIDQDALDHARTGMYSLNDIEVIPNEYLTRFFRLEDSHYKVTKELRSLIVFTQHNLISDPPFSRIDLIVCRNVMIYLDIQRQKQLLSMYSAVLNPQGYLFLGSAEGLGKFSRYYNVLSKSWRIYNKNDEKFEDQKYYLSNFSISGEKYHKNMELSHSNPLNYNTNFRQLLDAYSPALILIDKNNQISYTRGQCNALFDFSEGQLSGDIYHMLHPNLRSQIRLLLNNVRSKKQRIKIDQIDFKEKTLCIHATPIIEQDTEELILLMFNEVEAESIDIQRTSTEDGWLVMQLEQELQSTREDLQRTIERFRINNEDLKAMNEEFVAMNEELQSSNEELESSKEELQSLNEELHTSNQTLDSKVNELEHTNNDLNNLFSSTDIATIFLDTNFHIKRYTPTANKLMHLKSHDLDRPFTDIAHIFDGVNLLQGSSEVMLTQCAVKFKINDNRNNTYIQRVLPYKDSSDTVTGIVMTFVDVTDIEDAKRKAQQLVEQLSQQNQILQLPMVYARDSKDRIIFWNDAMEKFYGYSKEQAIGKVAFDLFKTQFPEAKEKIDEKLNRLNFWQGELVQTRSDGNQVVVNSFWSKTQGRPEDPWTIVALHNDISEQKHFESEMKFLANYDPITHLPNQKMLMEELSTQIELAARKKQLIACLFLDLDRFKNINDSLGHETGDKLLIEVANRLRKFINEEIKLARFGGDEFAILLQSKDVLVKSPHLADQIVKTMAAPFIINNKELFISASIGISIFPNDANNAESLIRTADAALNMAKLEGRNQYQFITPELNRKAHRQLSLELHLHKALENKEIYLDYQPQVNLSSNKVVSAEALMRWRHPELGQISPNEFIPIAEESGIILQLGEWALTEVVNRLREWHKQGRDDCRLSVNISALQFRQPDFINLIAQLVGEGGFKPSQLELELTERVLVHSPERAIEFFARVRTLGLKLSFDDFGTGYCSLQYLRHLRLDHIKVAREFIPDDSNDKDNIAISRCLVSLAKALDIECTVEGIERLNQLTFFKELGCDKVQGFFFSKPISFSQLEALLLNSSPDWNKKINKEQQDQVLLS